MIVNSKIALPNLIFFILSNSETLVSIQDTEVTW